MAMVGVGCRAQSAVLVRPVVLTTLGHLAAQQGIWTRSHASSGAATHSWRAGSRVTLVGNLFRLGVLWSRGGIEVGTLPQKLSVRAINVSGPGSVDSPLMRSMQAKIKEDLNAESVSVKDAYGDGRHVSIDVVASVFEGKTAVNRQRMVYKAIWEELQGTVHAVDQLKTRTPTEAANSPDQL